MIRCIIPIMTDNAIALIDCNNFFVSCERVFDPSLKKRPVVVLSNNDGCIISRSDEVKAMGVKMAEPLFKVKSLLEANNTAILSSNIAIYCDISRKVMKAVRDDLEDKAVEVYSIDEAFLDLGIPDKATDVGFSIKQNIEEATGIPISVGIAKTKTLAKLTNNIAKKSPKTKGVLDLYNSKYINHALERTSVGNIWGIGSRSAKKLNNLNIKNALELSSVSIEFAQKHLNVLGGRTVLELRGTKCIPFEKTVSDKKSIAHTRSFGQAITEYSELKNAVLNFGTRAVERMRRDKLAAKSVMVFVKTNRFKSSYASHSAVYNSIYHSNLKNEINMWVLECFEKIFKTGLKYKKAGVVLGDLVNINSMSNRLYEKDKFERWNNLADVVDELNFRYGRDTVKHANISQLGRGESSHKFENKNATLPELDPVSDMNTSEFKRFI